MPLIRLKLKNPSETVYFQSILGTYCHIAWTRTGNPAEQIITVIPTEDTLAEIKQVLAALKAEIDFEEV